jgi:hypothetical protein
MSTIGLKGVRLKIDRADEHLETTLAILRGIAYGECKIVPEINKKLNCGVQRISLPKPPDSLSTVVGDFLFNIRSALDQLLWQLVLVNDCTPGKSNMFIIAETAESFAKQVKSGRLNGTSAQVKTLIEGLQPYHRGNGNESLITLARLHNTDKHQTPNLTTAVAHDTLVDWVGETNFMRMFLGDEELRDGAIFGGIGMPLNNPEFPITPEKFLKMKVDGHAAIFVAFDQSASDELEPFRVDTVLQGIVESVKNRIIPTFEPFFG